MPNFRIKGTIQLTLHIDDQMEGESEDDIQQYLAEGLQQKEEGFNFVLDNINVDITPA